MSFFSLLFNQSVFYPFFYNIDSQTFEQADIIVSRQIQKPPLYKVIMLNDDFTPMDFVVYILETIFQKENNEALKIMMEVHNTGMSNCGIYTYEIAEIKRSEVVEFAKRHQYPLQCILEKE